MTPEHQQKMIEGARAARLARKAQPAQGATNLRIAARNHAAVIDSIVLNGGDFLMKDAALQTASRLLKALSK